MIALLVSLLALGPQAAQDQRAPVPEGTVISSVDVSGFDIGRLSPGLREDIRALVGTPLKQERLDALAVRLEDERPRHVAAVRSVLEEGGKARVIFIVGLRGEDTDRDNINLKYVVEQVDIDGAPEDTVSQALRDDVQKLVGRPLDHDEAAQLQQRLERELPKYDVKLRIQRGSERGRTRVVFEVTKKEPPRWLRFEPLRSNLVYHSEHEWGSYFDIGIGDRDIRFTPILAFANSDDLVEEFSGYGLRFETRRLGTQRLGASLEWSSFDPDWRAKTVDALAADPSLPRLYDTRSTITPLLKFAFTPELSMSAGVGITELEPLAAGQSSQMANAAIGALDYKLRWSGEHDTSRTIESQFLVRAGTRSLESDLAYNRYAAQGAFEYERGKHQAVASGMLGRITGTAPLFERFTLGDTRTLRGWDKYDVAPAGGSRLLYASVEYRYSGVGVFLDLGSVWDEQTESRVRASTGLTFLAGPTFASIGFPLNTSNLTAIFSIGIRVQETKLRW
jgi:Omp85 superfamily domain